MNTLDIALDPATPLSPHTVSPRSEGDDSDDVTKKLKSHHRSHEKHHRSSKRGTVRKSPHRHSSKSPPPRQSSIEVSARSAGSDAGMFLDMSERSQGSPHRSTTNKSQEAKRRAQRSKHGSKSPPPRQASIDTSTRSPGSTVMFLDTSERSDAPSKRKRVSSKSPHRSMTEQEKEDREAKRRARRSTHGHSKSPPPRQTSIDVSARSAMTDQEKHDFDAKRRARRNTHHHRSHSKSPHSPKKKIDLESSDKASKRKSGRRTVKPGFEYLDASSGRPSTTKERRSKSTHRSHQTHHDDDAKKRATRRSGQNASTPGAVVSTGSKDSKKGRKGEREIAVAYQTSRAGKWADKLALEDGNDNLFMDGETDVPFAAALVENDDNDDHQHGAPRQTGGNQTSALRPMDDMAIVPTQKDDQLQKKQRIRVLIVVLVVLLLVGGGVGAYFATRDDSASTVVAEETSSTPNEAELTESPTMAIITSQPTISTTFGPTVELTYDPPSTEDCAAIAQGLDIEGQNGLIVSGFEIIMEAKLVEAADSGPILEEVEEHIELFFVPELVGCPTTERRQLRDGHDDKHRRQLASIQYVIANAEATLQLVNDGSCETTEEICYRMSAFLELALKGDEKKISVLSIVLDAFGEGNLVGPLLLNDPIKDLRIVDARSTDPTSAPSVSPSGLASSQPSSLPSSTPTTSSPTALESKSPSFAPVIGPTTIAPTKSATSPPTKLPSETPSSSPSSSPSTSSPTLQPALGVTPVPTLEASAPPTEVRSSEPSLEPTIMDSMTPTAKESEMPTLQVSEVPTVQVSVPPSVAPSSLPSVIPSFQPSSAPSVAAVVTPSPTTFVSMIEALLPDTNARDWIISVDTWVPSDPLDTDQWIERHALVLFGETTNKDSWATTTNWESSSSICTWFGITCVDSRVTAMSLGNNNLEGYLPTALGQLTALTSITMNGNFLDADLALHVHVDHSIPTEFGMLTKLEYVNFQKAKLQGTIPTSIINLTSLTELAIRNNEMTGSIPPLPSSLQGCSFCKLHGNAFTDTTNAVTNFCKFDPEPAYCSP